MATDDRKGTKDRILGAAQTLFVKHGFGATTVRDIAREAGVNIALINYHFGTKEDLYKDLLRARIMPMFAVLDGIAGDAALPPPQKVERLIEAYIAFAYANPDVPRLLLREMTLRSGIAMWFAQEIVSQIAIRIFSVVNEAREHGYLRQDVDISVLIPSFIGSIVFGVVATPLIDVVRSSIGIPALDLETRKREVKDVILHGVRSR